MRLRQMLVSIDVIASILPIWAACFSFLFFFVGWSSSFFFLFLSLRLLFVGVHAFFFVFFFLYEWAIAGRATLGESITWMISTDPSRPVPFHPLVSIFLVYQVYYHERHCEERRQYFSHHRVLKMPRNANSPPHLFHKKAPDLFCPDRKSINEKYISIYI